MQYGAFHAKRRRSATPHPSTSEDRRETATVAPSIVGTYRLVRQERPGGTAPDSSVFGQADGIAVEFDGSTLKTTDDDQNTYIWEKVR